nr:Ig-like domain-containing protein [Lysinibacter cavernae]
MLPSYAGTATLEVKVPSLARQGNVNNNVALRLIAASGSNIVQTAGAARPLQSAAALVEGNVYRDLDFSGGRSASDAAWPAGSEKVALSQAGAVVATADIAADGTFAFPLVAAGSYELRLAAASEDGWLLLNESGSSFTVEPEGTQTVELLYQEILADTTLNPTSVIVAQGAQSDAVRIAELDELGLPKAPGSVFEADTVEIVDGPQYGTAQLVPGSDLSDIVYSAASDWPAEFAGQASYEDTVTYSWTNALGAVSTSTLTVTVRQGLVAVDDEFRTGDHESNLDVLANDVGVDLSLSGTPTTSADATVSFVNGKLRVIPTHVWAAGELEYEVPVRHTVADWSGETATATATVLVQRAPFGANQQAVIGQVGEHVFSEQVQSAGTIVSRVQIGLTPVGVVELGDGTVKFSTGGAPVAAGTYPITIQYTDDLGQTSNVVYTVVVLGAPQATGGTATVQQGGSHTFGNPLVSESDSIITDIVQPAQGNVSIAANGDVTFSAGTAARGDYAFTVTYTDEFGQAATANFVVTVQGSFSVVGETSATIRQNGEHTFSPVVTTDAPLTAVTVADSPAAGTLAIDEATGAVTFDAESIAPGTYAFGIEYENGDGQTILVSYTVTVQAKLQVAGETRKVAVGGTVEFTENITTTGSIVSREVIDEPASGEVTLGSVRFDAADAAPGTYTFTVRYTDNVGQTADATFEAIVQAAPTAEDINVTVPFGTTTVTVDPLGAVDGVGLQDLIVANVGQPQSGSTVLSATGMVVFTPPIGFSGTVTFFTTVSDDLGQTVLVKTQITVEPDGSTGGGDGDNGNGDNSSGGQGGSTAPGQDNQVTTGKADKGLAITGSGDAAGSLYLMALLFAVGIVALGFSRRRRQN